jgi:hypothetical protein
MACGGEGGQNVKVVKALGDGCSEPHKPDRIVA